MRTHATWIHMGNRKFNAAMFPNGADALLEMLARYRAGQTCESLAREIKVSVVTMSRVFTAMGERRSRGGAPKRRDPAAWLHIGNCYFRAAPYEPNPMQTVMGALARYNAGESTLNLSREFRVNHKTIQNIFNALGHGRGRGGRCPKPDAQIGPKP